MQWAPSEDGLYAMQFNVRDKHGNTNILDIIFDVSPIGNNPYLVEVRDSIGGAAPTSTQVSLTASTSLNASPSPLSSCNSYSVILSSARTRHPPQDIFNPSAQSVIIGQSLELGIWGYAPVGFMTDITYSFTHTQQSTFVHTCTGLTAYCELQVYPPSQRHPNTENDAPCAQCTIARQAEQLTPTPSPCAPLAPSKLTYTPEVDHKSGDLCVIPFSTQGAYVGARFGPSDARSDLLRADFGGRGRLHLPLRLRARLQRVGRLHHYHSAPGQWRRGFRTQLCPRHSLQRAAPTGQQNSCENWACDAVSAPV